MRITTWVRGAFVLAGLGLALPAVSANAEIIGSLEAPSGFASGISNVQGWVFTNTPGAELIQPFAVLINGVEEFKVPCCGDRGDVQDAYPDAPLLTGFSGVRNWGLDWTAINNPVSADTPQGGGPATQITVQVVVTDTMGGLKLLTKIVDLYHPTPWPRSVNTSWRDSDDPFIPELPFAAGGMIVNPIEADCTLFNDGLYGEDNAVLHCEEVKFTAPDASLHFCESIFYEWELASQTFKLSSDCIGGQTLIPVSK